MKRTAFLLLSGACLALPCLAQETRYRAEISAADRVNSRGVPLKTLREFLRQDRFNVHGGHHLDPGDSLDDRFGSVAARGLIDGARLVVPPGLEAAVVAGRTTTLEVVVSGSDRSLVLRVEAARGDPQPPPPPVSGTMAPGTAPGGEPDRSAPDPPSGFRVSYTTTLGPQDWVDSNGTPWSRLRDVLKQDRANVNRFGKADPGDERDFLFNAAAERGRFDLAPLRIDSALADPLSRREAVQVRVLLHQEGTFVVSRPGDGSGAAFVSPEDLLGERNGGVQALVASRDPGALAAARELVALSDLLHGRDHEESVSARVLVAHLLLQGGEAGEAGPLVEEIERDFRAAAGREVSPEAIATVMGFLVNARRALGEAAAAEALLRELLESPGRERWGLDEERRGEFQKLREEAHRREATRRESPFQAAMERLGAIEADLAADPGDRLAALTEALHACPRRRAEEAEAIAGRLRTLVSQLDRRSGDDALLYQLGNALASLASYEFRRGELGAARRVCDEIRRDFTKPELREGEFVVFARRLLVYLATAEGKGEEAEALARENFAWASEIFRPTDMRLVQVGAQLLDLIADRREPGEIERVAGPLAERALADGETPFADTRIVWHLLAAERLFAAGAAEQADAWYRGLADSIEKHPDLVALLGQVYSEWGHLYEGEGHYGRAEAIWSEGVARLEALPDLASESIGLLQDLSLVRKHFRDEQGAIALIERGRRLASERLGTDSREYAVACNNLVMPLHSLGRSDEALRMAGEALRVAEAHPDRDWADESALTFRNNSAIVLMSADPAAAAKVYEGIVRTKEEMGDEGSAELAIFLVNLGAARLELGDDKAAEEAYLEALDLFRGQVSLDRRNLAIVLDALAALAMRRGGVAEAAERVRESTALAEAFLANASAIASEPEKLALASLFDYGKHVHVLLAAGETEEACELSLRSKGVVLDQSIREARSLHRIATDESRRELFDEWRARQRQIQRLALAFQQAGEAAGEESPALLGLRQELKRIQTELLGEDAAGLGDPALPVDLAAVRGKLGEGERFYEFVAASDERGNPYLGAFVVSKDELRWVRLAEGEAARLAVLEFRAAVDGYLAHADEAEFAASTARLEKASRRLHELLWAPLEDPEPPAAGSRRLVLCPDGPLHFVPFAVLLGGEGRFVGEGRVLDYVVSARDFCREVRGASAEALSAVVVGGPDYEIPVEGGSGGSAPPTLATLGRLAAVGRLGEETLARSGIARSGQVELVPLPGAEEEARLIAETLAGSGAKVRILTAAAATERAVAGAKGPAIVHVATHGIFFDLDFGSLVSGGGGRGVDPMLRGALALAGAQSSLGEWAEARFPPADNDGWLFAVEAAQLDLGETELVTLSACETGIGDLASGEGVVGLRRAFLAAGARQVLSTLWPISDEMTIELMRDFYERLGRGEGAGPAFAGAQGEALRVFREQDARGEAIALFGAFVMNRAGS